MLRRTPQYQQLEKTLEAVEAELDRLEQMYPHDSAQEERLRYERRMIEKRLIQYQQSGSRGNITRD